MQEKRPLFQETLGHLNENVYVLNNEVILFIASSFCDENRFAFCGNRLSETRVGNVG